MPAINQSSQRNSPIGSSIRAQNALLELHTQDKVFEQSDQLMVCYNCIQFCIVMLIVSEER